MNPLILFQRDTNSVPNDGKAIDNDNLLSNDISSDFKDFLSKMLLEVEKDGKSSILKSPTSNIKETKTVENILKKDKINFKSDLSKSSDNFSLDELLQFVTFLKTNTLKGNFPIDTKKIDNILNDKKTLQDFKNIKNFKDLVKVAKKYDIKIEKFEFSMDGDKKVELKVDSILKKIDTNEKVSLEKYQISSEKILSGIKTKYIKNTNTKKINISNSKKSMLTSILKGTTQTNELPKEVVDDTKIHLQQKNNHKTKPKDGIETENEIKTEKDILSKKLNNNIKEENRAKSISDNTTKEAIKSIKIKEKKVAKEPINIRYSDQKIEDVKKRELKNKNVASLQENEITSKEDDKPKHTIQPEVKDRTLFDKSKVFNKIVDNVKKDRTEVSVKKHINPSKELNTISKDEQIKSSNKIKENQTHQNSDTNFHHLNEVFTKSNSSIRAKHTQAQQTLNSFVNDLKEQIDNYKPPVMRVKMTLNPKDLGSVDVSIISRGNNLQININANNNTMAIFTQNQAEFKNALVNMGFTNLNMNFSDQRGSKEQQKGESTHNITDKIEDETYKEEVANLELIIPKYT